MFPRYSNPFKPKIITILKEAEAEAEAEAEVEAEVGAVEQKYHARKSKYLPGEKLLKQINNSIGKSNTGTNNLSSKDILHLEKSIKRLMLEL
jgi:hypothetical protein